MQKLKYLVTICLLLISLSVLAQSKAGADYFQGSWDVLLKGTPGGDSKLVLVLDRKDSVSLSGVVLDTAGAEVSKIGNIDLKDAEITVFFAAQGYDLNLLLARKDDDFATGSLISMFEAEARRRKSQGTKLLPGLQ